MPDATSNARAWLEEADRLHQDRQFGAAIEHYRQALTRDLALFGAWYGLGCAQSAVGEHGAAIAALRGALTLRPDATPARINLAQSLFALGHVSDAVREYQLVAARGDPEARAVALANIACIAPGDPALDNAAVLLARRTWAEAVAPAVTPVGRGENAPPPPAILGLDPGIAPPPPVILGFDPRIAPPSSVALGLDPRIAPPPPVILGLDPRIAPPSPVILGLDPRIAPPSPVILGLDPRITLREHDVSWPATSPVHADPRVEPEDDGKGRHQSVPKLRVGYYGTFFGSPNWMKLYMGVINAHDRDAIEVNLIVDGALPSAEAGYRDHPDDRIWQVDGVPNSELARLIAEAKLDILVDLNGYSHQDRMGVLAFRAAPVQIAWLGMYGTTGFASVDCVVGDAASIPPEEEPFHTERVRRVPHTYLAFDMFYPVSDVVPAPRMKAGYVTFGSLVSAYKITGAVIASWSRILHGVPGSRLLLRNRVLGHASNRSDILARFAANGIAPERLTLEGGGAHLDFLRTYDRIDIALDSFPYSGATTTAEAIWQGVPVLTFNGDRWAARTSRSILLAAGLGDWVAEDQSAFEAMAIRLGLAPEGLAEGRSGLRARVAASPACDTIGLCRSLEAIYRDEFAAKLRAPNSATRS